MFQRSLLRASRQVAVAARPAAFAPIRQQVARTRAAAPAIRWYSEAPAAKEGEAAEKKEDAPKDEAAQLKEQLEKKDKEIVDLKVRVTQLNPIAYNCWRSY
jgi:molecular chaperone GrpE